MNIQIEKGSLNGRIMPFLLRDLHIAKQNGMLSISSQSVRKFVFFEEGSIIFTQSSLTEEQLGILMLRGGVYSDEKYEQISTLVREGGWKNPKIQEMNLVKLNTIDWWMRTLVREVLLSMIEWNSGDYHFMFDKKPPVTCPVIQMDTMKLLLACIRRVKNLESLQSWIGTIDSVPMIDSDMMTRGFADLNLTPQEGFFLSRIDGSLSFRQILTLSGPQKQDMLRFLVSASLTGLIKNTGLRVVFKPSEPIKATVTVSPPPPPIPSPPPVSTPSTSQLEENTEDVTLTADELREIAKLGKGNWGVSSQRHQHEYKETGSVDGKMKLEYLRDGEYVSSGAEGDSALDIGTLKSVSDSDGSDLHGDKITFLIDGQEVDGENNLFGQSSLKDLFSSGDAEEQWGRWMVSADESEEELLNEWNQSWKSWEEQSKEIDDLQRKLQDTQNALKNESNKDHSVSLAQKIEELERMTDQIISSKKREILIAQRRAHIQTHYEIMHIPDTASINEIREAYFKWLSEYQPEPRYLKHFDTLKDAMSILSERLHEAYEALSDEENRRRYDESLKRQKESARAVSGKKKVLAEDHLLSSRNALKRGDTMLAMRFLRASISLDPRNAIYYEEMADIIGKNPRWWHEAMRFYHRAFHLNPENVDLLIEVALLATRANHPEFAERALNQVLRSRPGHARATKLMNDLNSQRM